MKAYITGISGTGKSSIVRALQNKKITAFDIDEVPNLCRWINITTGQQEDWTPGVPDAYHDAHGWMCDVEKLQELIARDTLVVVAGAAFNQQTYLHLFDTLFFLHCSEETFLRRIDGRTDNDFGKAEVERARLIRWAKEYEEEMRNKGARFIDAEKPLEEVVAEIYAALV